MCSRDSVLYGLLFYLKQIKKAKLSIKPQICNIHLELRTDSMASSNSTDDDIDSKDDPTDRQEIKASWEREQIYLREKILLEDVDDWAKFKLTDTMLNKFPEKRRLQYIGGVDISFIKGDDVNACAAFVVLEFPKLEVIYKDLSMIQLKAPYIAGFLAFREVEYLKEKIEKLQKTQPDILPQVILVDGNGILHPKGFGLACHLGVLINLPTVGVAKNLLYIDGIERNEDLKQKIKTLHHAGDWFPLIGLSGKQHGVVYRSCSETTNPIYISPGHKISMETAVWVVEKCIKYRIPEPTRQADILSREYIRSLCNIGVSLKNPTTRVKRREKKPKSEEHENAESSQKCNIDSTLEMGINLWNS